jgi:hypothetical protein
MTPSSRSKSSLAATSALAGILAGVLGAWLTGDWLWGAACGFLVLLGGFAGAEALKVRREGASPAAVRNLSGNASMGDALVGGRDMHHSRTARFHLAGGAAAIIAIVALGSAAVGTIYMSLQPGGISMEPLQNLTSQGNHNSPDGAVKGLFGDSVADDGPGLCSYLLPDEQGTCNTAISQNTAAEPSAAGDKIGFGNSIVSGTLALVPVVGKFCESGNCESASGTGLPSGMSFQTAFQQAMSPNEDDGNNGYLLMPCEEIDGLWYVSFPGL